MIRLAFALVTGVVVLVSFQNCSGKGGSASSESASHMSLDNGTDGVSSGCPAVGPDNVPAVTSMASCLDAISSLDDVGATLDPGRGLGAPRNEGQLYCGELTGAIKGTAMGTYVNASVNGADVVSGNEVQFKSTGPVS